METMFMQNFGGQTKSIMVFLKGAYLDGAEETYDGGKSVQDKFKTRLITGCKESFLCRPRYQR